MLPDALGHPWRAYFRILVAARLVRLAGVRTTSDWSLAWDCIEVTPALSLKTNAWLATIPASGTGMLVYAIAHLWRIIRDRNIRHEEKAKAVGLF